MACKKSSLNDDLGGPNNIVDPNYPTVYLKKDSTFISERRSILLKEYTYLNTSIDDFGFCGYSVCDYGRNVWPPSFGYDLSEEQAMDTVLNFISKNGDITGVINTSDINFINKEQHSTTNLWHFRTRYQKFDTIEVLFTEISINLYYGRPTHCFGNWFPEVYIPATFNYNPTQAKAILLNKEVIHIGFVGNISYELITQESLDSSSVRLVVFPVRSENKIELFVTWEVHLPQPVYYKIYVDVMSGEIIREIPTVIS